MLVAAVSAAFFLFRSGDEAPREQETAKVSATDHEASPPAEHLERAAEPGAGEPPAPAQPGEAAPREAAAPARVERSAKSVAAAKNAVAAPSVARRPSPKKAPSQQPDASPPSSPKPSSSRPQVTVQSTPAGAQIFGGGRQLGTTPRKFYSEKGFTLMLKRPGYQPAYLTAKPNHHGVLTARMIPLPEYQRTNSLDWLKQLYRARQMSRRQWKARIKTLMEQRGRRIRAIKEAYKRGQFTRSVRDQRIKAVKDHYR